MAVAGRATAQAGPAAGPRWRTLLTPADLAVLRVWLISRCAVLALTWPAMWLLRGSSTSARPWLGLWTAWDFGWFQRIAQHGYFPAGTHGLPDQVAFLPGFPLVLALVHLVVRQWVISGLLVSFLAGGVAMVALGRITQRDWAAEDGSRAVLYLVTSPAAIFLAAGYAESLFLACALWAWLAARSGRYPWALLLASAAMVVKANGLFLFAALLVEIARRPAGRRVRVLALAPLALLPVADFELYLHAKTGDWLAWQHAEAAGWARRFTSPVSAFRATWTAGFGHEFAAQTAFVFQLELLAMLACAVVTAALLIRRRWPEAVYVGLTVAALATSTWYESVPRALLLLWPAWCMLAALAGRRPWTGRLYLALSVPLSLAIGLLYLTGSWAG